MCGPWGGSLPLDAPMPRGTTNELDQPTHPAAPRVGPPLSNPGSTPLPKPFPSEFMESKCLSSRGQG